MLLRSYRRDSRFQEGIERSEVKPKQQSNVAKRGSETGDAQTNLLLEALERYEVQLYKAIGRVVKPEEVESVVAVTYDRAIRLSQEQRIRRPRVFILKIARNILIEKLATTHALAASMVGMEAQPDCEEGFARSEEGSEQP